MDDLFKVSGENFLLALNNEHIETAEDISLLNIFDIYVKLAMEDCNVIDESTLRSFIFNQFKKYGDFDKEVRKTAQIVSEIVTTTGEAITAIESDKKDDLSTAVNKLKDYEGRIQEQSKAQFTDDVTGLSNRSYLFSKLLHEDMQFKENGTLFLIQIEELANLDEQYGPIITKSIMRKFSKTLQKAFAKYELELINYEYNEFLILAAEDNVEVVEKTLELLHTNFETKKFKIPGDKVLEFNLSFKDAYYKKDQAFSLIYQTLNNF